MAVMASEPLFDQESGTSSNFNSLNIEAVASNMRTQHDRSFGRPVAHMTFNETATSIVAAFTVILAIFAMFIEGTTTVVVAGCFAIAMGLGSHFQQTQLSKVAEFREKTENLEGEMERIKGENQRLVYYAEELEGRLEDLLDVEDALAIITQGNSIDALQQEADANLEQVCNLQQSVKTNVIEALVSFFHVRQASPDMDMDMPITEDETKNLIQKLNSIAGLTVNEYQLRSTIKGNKLDAIIDTLFNLLNDNLIVSKRIFQM